MNAPVQSGVAGFLARYEALRDRLPGDVRERETAAEAFRRSGLPGATSGRREEAWKYTSLRALADASFSQSPTQAGDVRLWLVCRASTHLALCSSMVGSDPNCPRFRPR